MHRTRDGLLVDSDTDGRTCARVAAACSKEDTTPSFGDTACLNDDSS
jgi:hypothetical protein